MSESRNRAPAAFDAALPAPSSPAVSRYRARIRSPDGRPDGMPRAQDRWEKDLESYEATRSLPMIDATSGGVADRLPRS